MSPFLFENFTKTSVAAWKQKIQFNLKGKDYNSLLSKTSENITIKPFYTAEDRKTTIRDIDMPKNGFSICQSIFIDDEKIANSLALNTLKKGATSIQFVANKPFNPEKVLSKIDVETALIYFKFQFLSSVFLIELSKFINPNKTYFQIDVIGNLAVTGNWFINLKEDFIHLEDISKSTNNCINVSADIYQNAGANNVQQLAYALAHGNEYLNRFGENFVNKIHFSFSVGSNYFVEIAKLRAFRILWETLLKAYNCKNKNLHIFVQPSLYNKTIYDYNVNMLRTTSECMSAILGGANTVCNLPYDTVFRKSNEFGERISRNQLLILQQESELQKAQNYANGSYYIESLTEQLAEKALILFKEIESNGGFLKQLKKGTIQRKIEESAQKEQKKFNTKEIVLLGTNLQVNLKERMNNAIELYPFLKKRNEKTLIKPILKKRLSELEEQKRLKSEKGI